MRIEFFIYTLENSVMDWTIKEFIVELSRDPARRVLFVEGTRDIAFWRSLFPQSERRDTVIYTISKIKSPGPGGERGRLMRCAHAISGTEIDDRVRFFADADFDRVFLVVCPENVTLTDGRDLESYGLNRTCMIRLSLTGLAISEAAAEQVLPCVLKLGRSIAMVRIASERKKLNLPFQRTIGKKELRKLVDDDGAGSVINIDKLITTLHQNASMAINGARLEEVKGFVAAEEAGLKAFADDQVVHGKDATDILAWMFDAGAEEIERLWFACMNYQDIAAHPNISTVIAWLRRDPDISLELGASG